MFVRKNVRSLTAPEQLAFVTALLELKAKGKYDKFVHWHHQVMQPAVLPFEPRDGNYRNGAHRGPAFLPWHREFLYQLETELRAIDSSVSIPYWNWTEDTSDPAASPVWSEDFMGGNGVEADEWRVASGPFAHGNGRWPVPDYGAEGLPGPGLKRSFGQFIDSIPTPADLQLALGEVFYDTPPYSASPFTIGFRNRLEGFVTRRGDSRVSTTGSQLHNRVHVWVGGNMLLMTSPEDPVFFLHHCFIDKVWADWQELQQTANPDGAPHYAPLRDGPPGHNIDDGVRPGAHTIREVLDISALGYSYEQPPDAPDASAMARTLRPVISPFWVD
ncbi:tyrosinase family protein [Arthrobacter sp. NicSoilB8]|uniref:tyrosinase family protein n=1 Tax=Arthrobacter sp. NicSoilB8 TaxID=2830998 RepID=UPI001CC4F3B9|nr:tyrosinase family protein [Arthrobacter sp. NicSoilB8]BCW72442.1 tyrosinase [Arthrobacter sp. NicSoilB8]